MIRRTATALHARLAPPRVAHAHDGHDHDGLPTARPVVPARPARRIDPHGVVPLPFIPLGPARAAERGKAAELPDPRPAGAKAASLAWLTGIGVAVPAAIALPAETAAALAGGDSLTRHMVEGALTRWLDPASRYAVRSSADVEDGEVRSWAGQFSTRLDLTADEVRAAIAEVATPGTERLRAYAERTGEQRPPRIGVVVQEMVPAQAAGVAFSRNPLSGLDEVVVEAVPGLGAALVDEGITPDRWTWRWGAFTAQPAEPRVGGAPIEQVVRETLRIAKAAGRPLDLEWAWDGRTLWWLQSRPMTGLDGVRIYSNRISREVFPGLIPTLVWSINVPIVNAAWVELLERLAGPLGITPEMLARRIGCRAYFDMTTLGDVFTALGMPREALELLLGLPRGPEAPRFKPSGRTWRHLPRMLRFSGFALRAGGWGRREVDALAGAAERLERTDLAGLDDRGLLARIDEVRGLVRRGAMANIIIPLLMLGYGRGLDRSIARAGLDPLAADPAAEVADRRTWDPNPALDELRAAVEALPATARTALDADPEGALDGEPALAGLRSGVAAFLDRFGHLSASGNDLSVAPWREDRAATVQMILAHPLPRERSGPQVNRAALMAATPAPRRPLAGFLWGRAGEMRVLREAVSSTYTRVYGLLRGSILVLGERLVARGLLDTREDLFHLTLDEIRELVERGTLAGEDARTRIADRRAEMAEAAELIAPEIVVGDAFVPRRRDELIGAALSGVPTSRGSARGTARVVQGPADFARVGDGEIIVIPYSDVAWTPLFARASGVVAEAGGLLSHSSIVAREYGIPCVVSVSGACAAIPDGATVVVDGVGGSVLVEREPAAP